MPSLRPFRWLALICVLGIAIGIAEINRPIVDIERDPERNYPRAMAELYPGSAQVEFLAGLQATPRALNEAQTKELQEHPEQLEAYLAEHRRQLEKARGHFERALSGGLKSSQDLRYQYALTLMKLDADRETIEREIAAWRRDFPHSNYEDLQTQWASIQTALRKQEQFLRQLSEQRELDQRRRQLEQLYGPRMRPGSDQK